MEQRTAAVASSMAGALGSLQHNGAPGSQAGSPQAPAMDDEDEDAAGECGRVVVPWCPNPMHALWGLSLCGACLSAAACGRRSRLGLHAPAAQEWAGKNAMLYPHALALTPVTTPRFTCMQGLWGSIRATCSHPQPLRPPARSSHCCLSRRRSACSRHPGRACPHPAWTSRACWRAACWRRRCSRSPAQGLRVRGRRRSRAWGACRPFQACRRVRRPWVPPLHMSSSCTIRKRTSLMTQSAPIDAVCRGQRRSTPRVRCAASVTAV